MPSAERIPAGQRPETTQEDRVSTIRGQHKTPAHSDASSRCGKRHERIVAYTIPERHPVYEPATCPMCGSAVRWFPLGQTGNLVPRCENEKCVGAPRGKKNEERPVPDAIKKRRWQRVGRGGPDASRF